MKDQLTTLLERLPDSWDSVTLKQFQDLTGLEFKEQFDEIEGIESTIAIISKLTGESVDEIELLSIREIMILADKLKFMIQPPAIAKTSSISFKPLDKITYNDYISFIQIQKNQLQNLHTFVKNFSTTELTEDEILQLPITDVLSGFFLSMKAYKKYAKRLILSTRINLIHQQITTKLQPLLVKMKR